MQQTSGDHAQPLAHAACAVVVVNYGSAALLAENLVRLNGVDGCRVIVVDNFSSTAERQRVRDLCDSHGWTAVLHDRNLGFAGGVNAGLAAGRELGADSFLLLNPDAVITGATAQALAEHVRRNRLELVAPKVVRPDGSTWSAGSAVDLRTGRMCGRPGLREVAASEQGWLSGACVALSAELLDRVGGMADGYFLYWEDVDLSMRVQRAGGTLAVRTDLQVVHDEGGTQRGRRSRRLSDRYYFYNTRNRLVFGSRWLNRRQLLGWLAATPGQSWAILLRGGRRQLLESPRPLAAAVAGSVAGLATAAAAMIRRPAPPRPVHDHQPADDHGGENTPVTALMSFPATPPKTNPYRLLLERGLRNAPGLTIKHFSWRTALLGDYDVFHVHWPEILLEGRTPLRTVVRRVLFVAFMIRMQSRRTPIVRTLHNLELPKDIDPIEVALLRATERRTALWIRLNTSTELPADRPGATVLHGHYRDWYAGHPRADLVPGRLLFHGLVRRYKGVPDLVRAFGATTDPNLSLHVVGKPSTAELAEEIRSAAAADSRVGLTLEFVEDHQLVAELTAAELVVLPYAEMHNSAAVLTALSLDRPVLVPENEVNRKLAAEVGPGWIHTYTGRLTAAILEDTLRTLRAEPPEDRPDLDQRDWDLGGIQHADAYRTAIARR